MEYNYIFHLSDTDLDGFGSQYMTSFLNTINPSLTIKYYNTGLSNIFQSLSIIFSEILKIKDKKFLILITDISPTKEIADKINNFIKGNKNIDIDVKLFDHHLSNPDIVKENEWCHINIKECSASITAKFVANCVNGSVGQHLIAVGKLIKAHDLWEEDSVNFDNANLLADQIKKIYFPEQMIDLKQKFIKNYIYLYFIKSLSSSVSEIENFLPILMNKTLELISSKDMNLFNKDRTSLHNFYYFLSKNFNNYSEKYEVNGFTFKIAFDMNSECFQYFSHFYLEDSHDIDFIVNVKKTGNFSFRSVGNIDVNRIANKVIDSGGGHFNAAGAKINQRIIHEGEAFKIIREALLK